ncbi:hypothetical protein LINPERPRIM_LOCUS25022, partial [Linum perenne]
MASSAIPTLMGECGEGGDGVTPVKHINPGSRADPNLTRNMEREFGDDSESQSTI